MKRQRGLPGVGTPAVDGKLSDTPYFPAFSNREASDLNAMLQLSSVTISEFMRKLTACKRDLAIAQRKMETLQFINADLHSELSRVKTKADKALYLASHDELTGLANRRLLLDRLTHAIGHASRQKRHVALIFFDIDGFKVINDTYGHEHGDTVLQCVAQRLLICLRSTDTACRYGGDEFIVMLPEIAGGKSGYLVEQKLRAQLAKPYLVNGDLVTVNLSIGIATYPDDARDHQDLIRLADVAMYNAKPLKAIA